MFILRLYLIKSIYIYNLCDFFPAAQPREIGNNSSFGMKIRLRLAMEVVGL